MVTDTIREENGEFCVAVVPATRTAGILTSVFIAPLKGLLLQLDIGAGVRKNGAGCQIEPAIRPILYIWVIYWLNWV